MIDVIVTWPPYWKGFEHEAYHRLQNYEKNSFGLRRFTEFNRRHSRFRLEHSNKMRDIVATDLLRYLRLGQFSFGKQLFRYRDSVLSLKPCRRQSRYTFKARYVRGVSVVSV